MKEIFSRSNSSGLSSMRERAELLGGRLTIESRPMAGTMVEAELRLDNAVEVDDD
jgi:signal transduction histidine kinase